MTEYELTRSTGRCSVSGRAFAEGEVFYSVVHETPQGLERRDIAEESWQGPPADALCHYKTRMPEKQQPKKAIVDSQVLLDFLVRLADSEDEQKLRFRFVLALMLMRQRVLKYDASVRDGGREYWDLRLVRDKSVHRVLHPQMNEAEIEALTRELGALLQWQAPDECGPGGLNDAVDAAGAEGGAST